ncbi:winged helix-turn-helix domain-containing protein [Acrocarpospora corrugata]|uniref:winged helix-turn-helix domain-containing protein n=1 Tax=Acrocarpospora corrugata TaxID=35763 RepID=UPI001C3F63D1
MRGWHRTEPHRTATRDGRPLDLSVKEFALLEALRVNPAHLSTEALLEQVWDEHADPFTNTVTVTIGRLHRKLGQPPPSSPHPALATHRQREPITLPASLPMRGRDLPTSLRLS